MVNLEKLDKSDQTYESNPIYYKNMYGRRVRVAIRNCKFCKSDFIVPLKRLMNDNGDYCSVSCSNKHRTGSGDNHPSYKGKVDYIKNIKNNSSCSEDNCNENRNESLCFHHISSNKKIDDISRMSIVAEYDLDDIKQEVEKCILICHNCHRIKHQKKEKDISIDSYTPDYDNYSKIEGKEYKNHQVYTRNDDKYNRSRVIYNCKYCDQKFFTRVDHLKLGRGRFHSPKCSTRYHNENSENKKGYVRNIKNNECCSEENCDESRNCCLDFHHNKNEKDNKEGIISSMVRDGASFQELKKEIEKCELICANCHQSKHTS